MPPGSTERKWSVQVYGKSFLDGPILDTCDAERVVVRGPSGNPVLAVVKVADGTFMACDRGEDDWVAFCGRFGIS